MLLYLTFYNIGSLIGGFFTTSIGNVFNARSVPANELSEEPELSTTVSETSDEVLNLIMYCG